MLLNSHQIILEWLQSLIHHIQRRQWHLHFKLKLWLTYIHILMGDLSWRSNFTLVTFKHLSFPLKCYHQRTFALLSKFHRFPVNNMVLLWFPKDQVCPHWCPNNCVLGRSMMDNVMLLVIHSQRRSRRQIKEFRFNFCNLSKSVVYASLFWHLKPQF